MNGMNQEFDRVRQYENAEVAVRKTMLGVYGWMTLGLIISAIVGFGLATNVTLLMLVMRGYLIFAIAQIVLVCVMSGRTHRMSATSAKLCFVGYAVLNGITFATVFAAYGLGIAGYAFLMTALVFGVMTIYGYVTKTDLTKIGNLFVMALFGLVIATLVNFIFPMPGFNLAVMYVGIIIFIGLIGYDTQKIKQLAYAESQGVVQNASILGALTLYLDFINIFIRIARLAARDR